MTERQDPWGGNLSAEYVDKIQEGVDEINQYGPMGKAGNMCAAVLLSGIGAFGLAQSFLSVPVAAASACAAGLGAYFVVRRRRSRGRG